MGLTTSAFPCASIKATCSHTLPHQALYSNRPGVEMLSPRMRWWAGQGAGSAVCLQCTEVGPHKHHIHSIPQTSYLLLLPAMAWL